VLDNLTRVTVAGRQKGVGFIFIRPLSHPGPIDKVHAMLRENVPDPIVYHCAMTIEIIPFSKIESSASAIDFSHHLPESVLRADLEIVTFFDPGALDWAEFLNALGSSLPERSKRFIYVPGPTTLGEVPHKTIAVDMSTNFGGLVDAWSSSGLDEDWSPSCMGRYALIEGNSLWAIYIEKSISIGLIAAESGIPFTDKFRVKNSVQRSGFSLGDTNKLKGNKHYIDILGKEEWLSWCRQMSTMEV